MKTFFRIGLTGGIGSGKSTVARIFSLLGIPVYNSDERAKSLMRESARARRQIEEAFGAEAYLPDGAVNRRYLASQVFGRPEKLAQLNAIVHPLVGQDLDRWSKKLPDDTPYYLQEAAILFESGAWKKCAAVVCVYAPEDLRYERVIKRDGSSREEVEKRAAAQISDSTRLALSNFVILNDGNHGLTGQVLKLHRKLKNLNTETRE